MSRFCRFGIVTVAMTYLVIFAGGLVRVSGAGLGCPDWPRCFGRWYPPTDVSQLPAHIDPSLFNFTLAWIEYSNRVLGALLGLFIVVFAIWALLSYRRITGVVLPAVAAALLVAFQGWQGSVVVSSLLEPVIVTVHMLLALLIVSLLIYATLRAHFHDDPDAVRHSAYPARIRPLTIALWGIAMIQVVMGTQIRQKMQEVRDTMPLGTAPEWYAEVGITNHIHLFLGLALAVLTWYTGHLVLTRSRDASNLARQSMVAMMVLVGAQTVIGFGFVLLGTPPVAQLLHLWVATAFVGLLLVMYTASSRGRRLA